MGNSNKTWKSRLWQRAMIGLARSGLARKAMQANPLTASLAQRFVGGSDSASLLAKTLALHEQGIETSLYYLGEYVESLDVLEENVQQIINAIQVFGEAAPDVFACVDPTQIGYALSDEVGIQNALRIGRSLAAQPNTKFMMIDMEDATYVDKSIALFYKLKAADIPAAITLQAYLHRTENDLKELVGQGAAIRLVKGAFAEGKDIAWTKKQDVDESYLRLARQMLSLEMKAQGIYPIFATHDDRIIDALKPLIESNGWQSSQYEIEMLLGVREELQHELVREGHTVRVYVPFGTAWWPYTARRIGENPANMRFVLQALWHRK